MDDAGAVGLNLNGKRLDPNGYMGIVTTYAQLGHVSKETGNMVNAELLRKICADKPTMVIADEMHHLGQGKNWGDAFEMAFGQHAVARLMTSGTPFRSDSSTLPGAATTTNASTFPRPMPTAMATASALGKQVLSVRRSSGS